MNKRTQTSMRLKKDTLDKLKKLKKKTGLSMARVLALIVDDYLGEENEQS
jgi:predicted DNA-binding protein